MGGFVGIVASVIMRALRGRVLVDDHAVVNRNSRPTNAACALMSSFGNHLTWPLWIMFTFRYPEAFATPTEKLGTLTRSDPPLDCSVVLLNDVVQVADGPAPAAPAEFTGPLQFRNDVRI
jgi:hypothetical protein